MFTNRGIKGFIPAASTVSRNTLILYSVHVVNGLISIIFFGILARYLGISAFGVFSFVFASMTILQTVGAFGLDLLMIREIAGEREETMNIVSRIIFLKIIFSAAVLLMFVPAVMLSGVEQASKTGLLIFSPYIVLSNINLTLWYVGDGWQKMEYRGSFTVSYYILRTAVSWLVLKYMDGLAGLFVSLLLVESFFLSVGLVSTRIFFGRIALSFRKGILKNYLKMASPFAASSILLIILLRLDILVLNYLRGESAVGLYSPAQKFLGISLLFSTAFTSAFYPSMARSAKKSSDGGLSGFRRSLKVMSVAGIIFALLVTIVAGPAIGMVFGNEYAVSARILRILIWMCPLFFPASIFWVLFAVKGLQHWTSWIYSCGIVMSLTLNFYLARSFSYFGTALAMVLFSAFLFLLNGLVYYYGRERLFPAKRQMPESLDSGPL